MAQTTWQSLIADHTHAMTDVDGLDPCVTATEAGIADLETKVAQMAAEIGTLTPQWPIAGATAIAREIWGVSRTLRTIDDCLDWTGRHVSVLTAWVAFGAISLWVMVIEIGVAFLS